MPTAIQSGIDVREYWDYTLGEINTVIKAKKELMEAEEKSSISKMYITASMTAQFVGRMLNGKSIPSLYELFPNVYEQPEMDWKVYQAQFMSFAEEHNRQRGSNT